MQSVTSLQNPMVKLAASLHQKKNRDETGLFLLEGEKCVEEAQKHGLEIVHLFTQENSSEKILKKISTTDTPPTVVAVAKQFSYNTEDLFKSETPLIIALENVKDPGNLGTIIRTATAAGASGIILTGDTVDIFNPKVVRSTAGNLLKLPIVKIEDSSKFKETINSCKQCKIFATSSHLSGKNYYEADFKGATVIIFGSEAEGITDKLLTQVDSSVKIPLYKGIESLNLGISVGIILFEALRQRKSIL